MVIGEPIYTFARRYCDHVILFVRSFVCALRSSWFLENIKSDLHDIWHIVFTLFRGVLSARRTSAVCNCCSYCDDCRLVEVALCERFSYWIVGVSYLARNSPITLTKCCLTRVAFVGKKVPGLRSSAQEGRCASEIFGGPAAATNTTLCLTVNDSHPQVDMLVYASVLYLS